jgi:hypothetical protein
MRKIINALATLDVSSVAQSQMDRFNGFRELFEQPAAYSPEELIGMVFPETSPELTPFEKELIARQVDTFLKWDHELLAEIAAGSLLQSMTLRGIFVNLIHAMHHREKEWARSAEEVKRFSAAAKTHEDATEKIIRIQDEMVELFKEELRARVTEATARGKKAADGRHGKPGGSRDKQKKILQAWESGKYKSRDICAEQECGSLGMSFSAARKALRNTKDQS